MVPDKVSFEEVLVGCRKQNRQAQNRLYAMYFEYGLGICSRYVSDYDQSIQILNDGFLRVFRNIKKFDKDRDFKPWFKTIMVNTAINHVRKMKKFKNEISLEEASNISVTQDLLARINYQDLLKMIHSLSLSYRTVFNMYVIDGFKHEEIAKTLGVSVGTSKSNLSKARARLQEMVAESLNEKVG